MRKRLLATLLAALLVLALVPTVAAAAEYTVTEVVPCKYDNWFYDLGNEDLKAVTTGGDFYGSCDIGLVDKKTGREVVPCRYTYMRPFAEDLAAVGRATEETDIWDVKWGFIDATGKEVIPCKYDDAWSFSEGLAAVMLDTGEKDEWGYTAWKWGYIDKTGREVVPCKYDDVTRFSGGLAAVALDTGEKNEWGSPIYNWGLIDKTGREVVPCTLEYDNVERFSPGVWEVTVDGKRGFIDKTGAVIAPCKYDVVGNFRDGLAEVSLDGKRGFVDETGKEVIPCGKYTYVVDDVTFYGFSEGLARVVMDVEDQWGHSEWKWGYIDKTGREVVPCKYDYARSFSGGLAAVRTGDWETGKWGFIDTTGREVVPCTLEYDDIRNESDGIYMVTKDRKYGFISITENTAPALAYPATQTVELDGKTVTFECYALKDENGNMTNYIKLRDLAMLLNGSAAQFQVGWDGSVTITTGQAYTPNGSEQQTPFSGDRAYQEAANPTKVNGGAANLAAFVLNDDKGGGYTYYQLRDLGKALGFNVGWANGRGIFLETNKPYDPNN